MQYRKIGKTNLEGSILGFGASPLGNEFGSIDAAEGERAVHLAVDHGINYFDVAPYYGRTLAETRLGKALEGRREKVILATKCCRYDVDGFDFSARRVKSDIEGSLQRLRTDYVDLFQIHDIEFGDRRQIIEETIPAAREVQRSGKARHVGITAFPPKMLREVASQAPVDAILSYARYNLMVTDLDDVLRPFCEEQGIGLINASPLHMRILTAEGAPEWHPAPEAVKQAGRQVAAACQESGFDVADVALRFCLGYPHVASTLVGMSKQRHVEQNLRAMDLEIPPGLLDKIQALIEPVKNKVWVIGRPENSG
jgi:L-galactose dehydrogenase